MNPTTTRLPLRILVAEVRVGMLVWHNGDYRPVTRIEPHDKSRMRRLGFADGSGHWNADEHEVHVRAPEYDF